MACTNQTLTGIVGSCDSSKGGIVEVYIAKYIDLDSASGTTAVTFDVTARTEAKAVTAITGTTWYRYSFRKNTGSMTSTLNVDDANGVNFVQTEVVLQFSKMDTTKRVEMRALSLSDVTVVVRDANGVYWYLGTDCPVTASAGTGQTGQNRTDGNFYQLTLQANDDTYPIPLSSTAVTNLLAQVDDNPND